jgi:ketosteroid isomerase-like protein
VIDPRLDGLASVRDVTPCAPITDAESPVSRQRDSIEPRHEQVARAFVAAFNNRDRVAWASVFHADTKFRPTALVGARSLYEGHDGVTRFLDELAQHNVKHQTSIRKLRTISADQFILFTDVTEDGDIVSPGAAIVRLADGKIIEATAYLSDEQLLETVGLFTRPADTQHNDVSTPERTRTTTEKTLRSALKLSA